MTRPFCTKELHTRCRYNEAQCDCLCHKDNRGGVPYELPVAPRPNLEITEKIEIIEVCR